jgi:hypothetical protein
MGQHDRSEALFYYFRLEDQVPETHLLRLPRMVIQQSMATFFYHAFVPIHPANHSDFFNTHRRLHSESGGQCVYGEWRNRLAATRLEPFLSRTGED